MVDMVDCGIVIWDQDQPFRRSSFRNRMLLPGGNGIVSLSIPLVGGRSVKKPFKNIEIDYSSTWQRDHFRSLDTIYGNSPFYFQYRPSLIEIFDQKPRFLFDWNKICFDWIVQKMKIKLELVQGADQSIDKMDIKERKDFYLPSNHDKIENQPFIKYPQLFEERIGFKPNVSILDLLFNLGPDALKKITSPAKPL